MLGSAILFAVAIELALNCLLMDEKPSKVHRRKGAKPKNTQRHDLSAIYRSLRKETRDAIACEVAALGWKISDVLEFHKAMVMDWRYPVNRMSADGGLFWWGPEPLIATFKGIMAAWKKKYPRPARVTSNENAEAIRQQILKKRDEVRNKMNAARVTKIFQRN